MNRRNLLTVSMVMALALMLVVPANVMAGEMGSKEVLTGTIHCIDTSGKMTTKAGVCPADHIAHVIITDDGRAVMLGGGEKAEQLIRNLAYPAGTRVSVSGDVFEGLSAIEVDELWFKASEIAGPGE